MDIGPVQQRRKNVASFFLDSGRCGTGSADGLSVSRKHEGGISTSLE